jgi:acetoacetate decarboxylase
MGFVKTPEEIARIQARLSAPAFLSSEVVAVTFRTRPEIVERLLPPGLEPVEEPLASAMVGRWGRSNCVHAFEGGALYLRARHGDLEGDYCLSMPMSTDRAIISRSRAPRRAEVHWCWVRRPTIPSQRSRS